MIILGIETSCDDTGIAVLEIKKQKCRVLSNVVSSQIKVHAPYGGVVPNLAARAHLENIGRCLKESLKTAGQPQIDLIAVTVGPGLIPSLLVGANFAKALAYANNLPLVGINHIEGHIFANWLKPVGQSAELKMSAKNFPALCLIVSGGHTELALMKKVGHYKILGQTRDDAAGEAFDKAAKLLGLGYPGGPEISKRAKSGDPKAFNLPRPMIKEKNFEFSFSGLKTAVFYEVKKKKSLPPKYINDMAASFERAVVDVLIDKTIKAALSYKPKAIILCGGVAANLKLRQDLKKAIEANYPQAVFQIPDLKFCTDNGAMIALAGYFRQKEAKIDNWKKVATNANLIL